MFFVIDVGYKNVLSPIQKGWLVQLDPAHYIRQTAKLVICNMAR